MPSHPGYVPWASSAAARRTMQGNKRRDTKPEVALRSALHSRGWRYRVQYPVPGRLRRSVDIAFTRSRLAVFIDGCFWHGCPEHGSRPRANAEYWQAKIRRNQDRDRDTDAVLGAAGWQVLRIWEHTSLAEALVVVEAALRPTGGVTSVESPDSR